MILVQRDDLPISQFEQLLEQTRNTILTDFKNSSVNYRSITAIEFETLVCDRMCQEAIGTEFEGKIYQTGLLTFPDIIAQDKLGVEVKLTAKDGWTSTGNSVLESTRKEGVERIYMFFGKLGGTPDIIYRLYQDCLREVVVTHSPRYLIDMNLPKGSSIFDKMTVPYDDFRKNEPIRKTRNFYKQQLKEGEELWWIGMDDEADNAKPLIIKTFNSLDKDTREVFITESLTYFPEIFSSSNRDKFSRVSTFLINKYNAVSPSLRDSFTAGGQETINVNGQNATVPKIFYELQRRAKGIKQVIENTDEELLKEYWKIEEVNDRENQWLNSLTTYSSGLPTGITATDIYKSGL